MREVHIEVTGEVSSAVATPPAFVNPKAEFPTNTGRVM